MIDPWEREYSKYCRMFKEKFASSKHPKGWNIDDAIMTINQLYFIYLDMEATRRRLIRPEYKEER